MKFSTPALEIQLLGCDTRDRFLIRYSCAANEVEVLFPHPRESIWLKRGGAMCPREFFPLTWKKPEPRMLSPGEVLLVSVRLTPYWTSLHGQIDVECQIPWKSVGDDVWSTAFVQEQIELKLPSIEELKHVHRGAMKDGSISPEEPASQEVQVLE